MTSTPSVAPLEDSFAAALLISFGWRVKLHKIPAENTIEALPHQVVLTLELQLPKGRSQLIFKLEVSLALAVLKAADDSWFANLTDFLLEIPFCLLLL